MSVALIYLLTILLAFVLFTGFVCLQVHISKNNKRGKFVIPIVSFVLPIVMIVICILSFMVFKVTPSDTNITSSESVDTYVMEDYEETKDYYDTEDFETDDLEDESVGVSLVMIPVVLGVACVPMSIPCGITTLIIELVYRSKRNKKASAEEIIDIKNL